MMRIKTLAALLAGCLISLTELYFKNENANFVVKLIFRSNTANVVK